MKRYLYSIAVLAAVAIGLVVSGCGSSSKSSSTSSTSPSGSSTPSTTVKGPSGSTFKLGFICSCSGAQSAQLGGLNGIASAWADSVNAAGGINGHAVKLYTYDDGGDAATSLQDVKTMVVQDHIQAIVGEGSLVDATWASYVQKAGIPVVGGITPEESFLTNPDFFPSGTQLVVQTIGTIALMKTAGKSHLGLAYCAESPICAEVVPLAQLAGSLYNIKVTPIKISSTAPSYAAPCLSLKGAGADSLFVADNSSVVQRVVQGCAQQGYKPQVISQTSTTTNAWLTDSSLNGALLSGFNANGLDASSNPEIAKFQAAVNKYDNNAAKSSQFGTGAILAWAGGLLFQDAAKAANLTPSSTGADVMKGLYMLKNDTLDGIAPPLNFMPGKPAFIPCYFTEQVSGGKFTSLNGNKPTCLSTAQATAVATALKKLLG